MRKLFLLISLTLILAPCFAFAQTAITPPTAGPTTSTNSVEGPKLNVPIPTLPSFSKATVTTNDKGEPQSIDIPWLAEYLMAIYKYALIIGSVFAALLLIIGGFFYMVSGLNKTWVEKSKKTILGSISGLIILLAAYLILYMINPELTNLKSLNLSMVKSEPIVFDDQPITKWLAQSKKGACWNQIVQPTKTAMDSTIDPSCPFLDNNNTGGCATVVKPLFQKISAEIMADSRWPEFQKIVYSKCNVPWESKAVQDEIQRPWIYNWRCSRNCNDCDDNTCISKSTGQWRPSPHGFAVAVDVDSCHNPACAKKADGSYDTECEKYNGGKPMPTTMPDWVISIFAKHNFIWGGGWKNYYDPMHFEWNGNCDEGIVPTTDPAASGCCTLKDGTKMSELTVPQCEGLDAVNLPTWTQGACS